MRSFGTLLLALAYMFALTIFLSFVALWVCDGFYPVGWGWQGWLLRCVFWAMPLCLAMGSVLASFTTRQRLVATLLLIGTVPFIAAVLWTELQSDLSGAPLGQSPWLHLWLIAAAGTVCADLVLIRRASSRQDLPRAEVLAPLRRFP